MQVADADVHALQILRQALCHTLRQRCYQHALLHLDCAVDFADQIIHLTGCLAQDNFRVEQTCRADDLLDNLTGLCKLIGPWRGADVNRLSDALLEFCEQQRSVIKRGRQPETVFNQLLFAGTVTIVHGANLRHGHVAFVDEAQESLRKIIQKGIRRITGLSAVKVA